jgi:peptide-methionine (R)-S-oxide reductase
MATCVSDNSTGRLVVKCTAAVRGTHLPTHPKAIFCCVDSSSFQPETLRSVGYTLRRRSLLINASEFKIGSLHSTGYSAMDRQRSPNSKTALPNERDGSKDLDDATWRAKLTKEQYRVLRTKGTERAGSHEYDDLYAPGLYVCAGCETPLYESEMKFNCGCGWPGFWTNIAKAVREEPDADGRRVEILCNACNGHLGHVFRNEGFKNPLNERHCVNGASLKFIPK